MGLREERFVERGCLGLGGDDGDSSESPLLGDNMHVREVSVDVRLAYILHQTVELEHTFSDETMHVNIMKKISAINLYYKPVLNNQVKALMVKKALPTKKKRVPSSRLRHRKDKEKAMTDGGG